MIPACLWLPIANCMFCLNEEVICVENGVIVTVLEVIVDANLDPNVGKRRATPLNILSMYNESRWD